MRLCASTAFVLAATIAIAAEPVRETVFEAGQFRWPTIPGFHGSRIYFRDQARHNRVSLYSTDGKAEATFDTPVSAGALPEVLTLAIDSDGTVAVAWQSASGTKASAGIDYHAATGKLLRSIDTGSFVPAHLAFAPDHSLWSFGWQRDSFEPRRPDPEDYMTLRRFDPDWRQVAAQLPHSIFTQEPAFPSWQRRQLAISRDRIGVLAHPAARNARREWIETDFEGKLLGRWEVPFVVDRSAATSDGRVYLESGENSARIVAQLDRTHGTWTKIANPPPGILCGAEDNEVVFADWVKGQLHLRWYAGL
jgi:hypothetical protein